MTKSTLRVLEEFFGVCDILEEFIATVNSGLVYPSLFFFFFRTI
jgi:hypothetical protein